MRQKNSGEKLSSRSAKAFVTTMATSSKKLFPIASPIFCGVLSQRTRLVVGSGDRKDSIASRVMLERARRACVPTQCMLRLTDDDGVIQNQARSIAVAALTGA